MRGRPCTCCLALVGLVLGATLPNLTLAAQGPKNKQQNPAQARENLKAESIDQVAEQAFKQADRNHNEVLSRTEFQTAKELVEGGIMGLGQQGILGRPQRPAGRAGQKQVQAPNGAAAFGLPTFANKNRISPAEFKLYAHGLAQEADVNWAQLRSAQQQARGRYGMGRSRPMQQNMVANPGQ